MNAILHKCCMLQGSCAIENLQSLLQERARNTSKHKIAQAETDEVHMFPGTETEDISSQSWFIDPQNPQNWSPLRKWMIIWLLVITNMIAAICSTAFEPALPSLMSSLHFKSPALESFTVSIYSIGYVLGPLLVAPISELYGRLYVVFPAYVIFMVSLAICGASENFPLFIVFRAIMGFAGVGFVLLGPAVVADLMPVERGGLVLSVMATGPVVGPTLGPIMGGYIVEKTTWRWTFWSTLIALGVLALIALLHFKETYGPVLLAQKKAKSEKEKGVTHQTDVRRAFKLAWIRPFKMLFLSPIVPLLGFYTAITNSYAAICFATVGTVFQDDYRFSAGQSGMAYFGLTAGFLFCQITMGHFSDRHIKKMEAKHGNRKPEYRLPPIFIGAFLLPVGLFWYGWSLQYHTHWIVPIFGSAFIAIGILYTYLPVQMYLVDTFTLFAASANGACTIIRSVCAALIPLGANKLYGKLGYGWGNSLLAFIALAFVPVAVFLMKYGERIRTNPRLQPML